MYVDETTAREVMLKKSACGDFSCSAVARLPLLQYGISQYEGKNRIDLKKLQTALVDFVLYGVLYVFGLQSREPWTEREEAICKEFLQAQQKQQGDLAKPPKSGGFKSPQEEGIFP